MIDCIAGQFLLDLLPSAQSHKWLHLDKTVAKEIRPGSSALRIQVLVFAQREKLHNHQLPSCLNLLCTTKWVCESHERISSLFWRARHRLAVPQTKEGRRPKKARQRREVARTCVQTYASIKLSCEEVHKRDENPGPGEFIAVAEFL